MHRVAGALTSSGTFKNALCLGNGSLVAGVLKSSKDCWLSPAVVRTKCKSCITFLSAQACRPGWDMERAAAKGGIKGAALQDDRHFPRQGEQFWGAMRCSSRIQTIGLSANEVVSDRTA